MTDRVEGFTVLLDQRLRDDDAERVADALRLIKGVRAVEPVVTVGASTMAAWRERLRLFDQWRDIIRRESAPSGSSDG